jgi:hypothetical protein
MARLSATTSAKDKITRQLGEANEWLRFIQLLSR